MVRLQPRFVNTHTVVEVVDLLLSSGMELLCTLAEIGTCNCSNGRINQRIVIIELPSLLGGDKQWGSALTRLDRSPRVVQEVVVGVHPLHWIGEDDDQPSKRLNLPEQLRGRDVIREVAAVRALGRPVQLDYVAKGWAMRS